MASRLRAVNKSYSGVKVVVKKQKEMIRLHKRMAKAQISFVNILNILAGANGKNRLAFICTANILYFVKLSYARMHNTQASTYWLIKKYYRKYCVTMSTTKKLNYFYMYTGNDAVWYLFKCCINRYSPHLSVIITSLHQVIHHLPDTGRESWRKSRVTLVLGLSIDIFVI